MDRSIGCFALGVGRSCRGALDDTLPIGHGLPPTWLRLFSCRSQPNFPRCSIVRRRLAQVLSSSLPRGGRLRSISVSRTFGGELHVSFRRPRIFSSSATPCLLQTRSLNTSTRSGRSAKPESGGSGCITPTRQWVNDFVTFLGQRFN